MEDDDIIALLYPADGDGLYNASYTINMRENRTRFSRPRRERPVPLATQSLQVERDPHKRQPTPEPRASHDSLDYKPCLRLTFKQGPKSRHGLVVGSNPDSDIVLPQMAGVSFNHFAFRFDDEYFYVEDLDSTCGTVVKYGRGRDNQPRRRGKFIIGGHEFLNKVDIIVIEVTQFLQFQVVMPVRDTLSLGYRERVARFREGSAKTDELFRELNFNPRPITRRPSGVQTPVNPHPLMVKRVLGSGAFGIAVHVWNARTGEQFVEKRPKRKDDYKEEDWKREAFLMRRVQHHHIVKFLGDNYHPHPKIRLEFVAGGSLLDHLKTNPRFSSSECGQILIQTLDGLKYLHGLEPPIIHRDISLSNILIVSRHDGKLSIKFSDFGLAKEGRDWRTICGNLLYLAPELYTEVQRHPFGAQSTDPYTKAIDIWSLGGVIAGLLRCHPKWDKSYQYQGLAWCEKIRENLTRYFSQTRDDLSTFLLANMLPLIPQARRSASDCYEEALKLLGGPEDSTGGLPSGIEGDNNEEQTTIRPTPGQGEDEQTVRPGSWEKVGTVDHYIIHEARYRSGRLSVDEERVYRMLPAGEILQRMANPHPDNSFFVGSMFEGVGANFDPGYKESSSSSEASQKGSDQIEFEATKPSLTSQESQEAPQSCQLGRDKGGEFLRGHMTGKMLDLQKAMRHWDEEAEIPVKTTELSRIWDAAEPSEPQAEPAQSPTGLKPPHQKRTWDNALDSNNQPSEDPKGKRMKNDEAPEAGVAK